MKAALQNLLDELFNHRSPVAKAALAYLKQLDYGEKTVLKHAMVLNLFMENLKYAGFAIERRDGTFVTGAAWDELEETHFSGFVDFWLPRKFLGPDQVAQSAPGVLRKWLAWSESVGAIDTPKRKELIQGLGAGKQKEVRRLQRAGDLLFRLHSPEPGAWMTGGPKSTPLHPRGSPDEIQEGYLSVRRIEAPFCHLQTEDGREIGPVLIGNELPEVLQVGDIVCVEMVRYGKTWQIVETGNVYPEGSF